MHKLNETTIKPSLINNSKNEEGIKALKMKQIKRERERNSGREKRKYGNDAGCCKVFCIQKKSNNNNNNNNCLLHKNR